ncbi:phosphotransferase family protein [Arsenicicoccus sp. oral taxon 190]|uniref:phosphotransferase family protein n=1 Tax=Arsenicicoccus sp. oral taxon 190 TaxID=1658671 RepID=UPI00067B9012|nr:phosphotransferase [Arsenicicoccus sp. oral taxon 190]
MITETELRAALEREWAWCGLSRAPEWVSLLGHGESYAAWHVATRDTDVVVRVVRRDAAELPRGMRDEFACLQRLPDGIGPAPIALDESGDRLGIPAMVVSLVAGEVLTDPGRWDDALLARLAQVIARLHAEPYDRCGPLDDPTRSAVSIVGAFEAGLGWWLEHHPEVVDDPEVLALLPLVRGYLAAREPWFEGVRRFALVHGDLVAANVLVERGEPRLVDWEWAEIDDPARDLGYLGGVLASPGVQVPLTRAQVAGFVRAYLQAAPADVYAAETEESLLARRDAWEVSETLLSSLHDRLLLRQGRDEPGTTEARVRLATEGLREVCR